MMINTRKWLLNSNLAKVYKFPPLVEHTKEVATESVDENLSFNIDSDELEHSDVMSNNNHDYQNSFEQGYKEGKEQGFQSGLFSGEEEGKRIGFVDGVRQGREEGVLQGKHEIDNKLTEILVPLMALKSLLEDGFNKQVNQQQQLIVDLVRRVTKQVIRCELALQPQQILTLVEETIASLPSDVSEIEIHLEPSAVKELQLLAFDKLKDWKIIPDPDISQGGCRIVTNKCDADASIETRLNACLDKVEEHLTSKEVENTIETDAKLVNEEKALSDITTESTDKTPEVTEPEQQVTENSPNENP